MRQNVEGHLRERSLCYPLCCAESLRTRHIPQFDPFTVNACMFDTGSFSSMLARSTDDTFWSLLLDNQFKERVVITLLWLFLETRHIFKLHLCGFVLGKLSTRTS